MYRNSLEILVGISPWQELTDAQHDYIHCEKHFVENSGYLTPSILAFHLPLFCFIFLFSIQAWPDGCGVGMRHLGMQVIASDQHLLNLAWTHRDIVNQTFVVVGILGSGMDMPLIALKKLFGGKAHLVKYLPLVSKTLNNSEIFFCSDIILLYLGWRNMLNLRSNSEKDKVAKQFLSENHEVPKQQLDCNNI